MLWSFLNIFIFNMILNIFLNRKKSSMLLKNTINKFFQSTNEKILEKRFKASKVTFIIFVFLFFLHYFFI